MSDGHDARPPDHAHHHAQPDFLVAMRADLADWRAWMGGAVVLLYAALAGLSVVAFTWLSERALDGFLALRAWHPLLPFVWTPLLTASIAWVTVRHLPGASGSGIPQVMASLAHGVGERERPMLV